MGMVYRTEHKEEFDYRAFKIMPDDMYGYSLVDRNGKWAVSSVSVEELKGIVDSIIETDG